jgi:hypothetical protein
MRAPRAVYMVARATLPNKAGYRDAVCSSLPIAQINLRFGGSPYSVVRPQRFATVRRRWHDDIEPPKRHAWTICGPTAQALADRDADDDSYHAEPRRRANYCGLARKRRARGQGNVSACATYKPCAAERREHAAVRAPEASDVASCGCVRPNKTKLTGPPPPAIAK